MIKGTIIGDAEAAVRFDSMPARLYGEVRTSIGRLVLLIQTRTKQLKLSGQVLKVRTGRLLRSINTRMTEKPGEVSGTVGTNVEYARIHEFGFHGNVNVKEHLRLSKNGFRLPVRAHIRRVDLPERSFLRSSLRDLRPEIVAELEQAATRSIT